MEIWPAIMIGFVGSLHCAGMCGPLVLAMPPVPGRFTYHLAGKLAYNGGRIVTYAVLGMIFGGFGEMIGLPHYQRWISIAAGAAIFASLLALPLANATNLIARPVSMLKTGLGRLLKARGIPAQFCFGILNGLLPCGLVYLACLTTVAAGNALAGMKYMAMFGLGTVPMMLGIALMGRLLHAKIQLRLQKLVPISLGIMAILLILRGLELGIPFLSPAEATCCH